jgi:hypothetical protein
MDVVIEAGGLVAGVAAVAGVAGELVAGVAGVAGKLVADVALADEFVDSEVVDLHHEANHA